MSETNFLDADAFERRLTIELERAERYVRPISFARLAVAAAGGSAAREGAVQTRQAVADLLKQRCRRSDIAGEFGRDELAIILPETDASGAFAVAERMRNKAAEAAGRGTKVTLSAGVASYPQHAGSAEDLMKEVDRALKMAKASGDRVCGPVQDKK